MIIWRGIAGFCVGLALAAALACAAAAQQPGAKEGAGAEPAPAPPREALLPKPDLADLDQIRFLTDSDYPPFNYLDEEGALTGFNVDLARAICEELVVECDVRSADWSALVPAIGNGDTDALVASIRTTQDSLLKLDFSDAYYFTPGRFAALKDSPLRDTAPAALKGRKIAVAAGTAHEAYLRDFYPESGIVVFEDLGKAQEALRAGEADILFGDGIAVMFWLNGTSSENCCEFRGGAYVDNRYFGEGVGIALQRGNRKLKAVLNYAIERLRVSGRLEELYLRYFPLSFF